jgi:hypothetical protein
MKPKVLKVALDGQEVEVCPVRNGWPVCVDPDGNEREFNTEDAFTKLKKHPEERTTLQKRAETAEQALAGLAALGDVDTIKAALETQKNLKAGQLMAAGEAQKVRDDAVREATERIRTMEADLSAARSETDRLAISHAFHASKHFAKDDKGNTKIRLKPSAVQALFGHLFRREADGTVAAYNGDSRVMSHQNIGDPADFDEALQILIDKSEHRDDVWAGVAANGSGATGGGRGGGDGKSIPRKQFESMSTAERNKFLANGGVPTD